MGQNSEVVFLSSHSIVIKKIELSGELLEKATSKKEPTSLWLGMTCNKEWYIGYRHAWGEAWVSTRQDGGDRYPVQTLRFRIEMPSPTGTVTDDQTRNSSATCAADCKCGGMVVGDFSCQWHAWATQPGFGTWDNSYNW